MESPAGRKDSPAAFLSIVVDDFDSKREQPYTVPANCCADVCERLCGKTRGGCERRDGSGRADGAAKASEPSKAIQKILEEAEQRKNEFWKLIQEHDEVVENLKRIEEQHKLVPIGSSVS